MTDTSLRRRRRPHSATHVVVALTASIALLPATAAAHGTTARGEVVSVTLTTANLRRALSTMPSVRFGPIHRHMRTLHVSDRTRYQRMLGFGAAMTDTSAWLLWDELTAARRASVMKELFAPSDIALNYVRVPMGASDFTHTGVPYGYDDGPPDPGLRRFSIAHDEAYILPAPRMMMMLGPSTDVLAGPWSAEPWMKANDAWDNLNFAGALLPGAYQPLANEFVDFIRAYASAGVPVSAVTPMNEAGTASEYPGTTLDEPAFVTNNLVPTLRAAGLRTRVYDLDGSGFSGEEQWLASPSYRATIAGTAVHCYAGLQQMPELHALNPSGSLIMSECSPNHTAYPTAEIAIVSARNYAQAVDLWNIALDPLGGPKQPVPGCDRCGALVTVDEHTHRARLTRSFYQFGQVARFVRRGATRIASIHLASDFVDSSTGTYGVTTGLDDVAFLNPDGTKVLIAYNNSKARIHFQVTFHTRGFVYTLAGRATATFAWR